VVGRRRKDAARRKDASIRIRISEADKIVWTRAAEAAGRDLSGWLRFVASRAVSEQAPSRHGFSVCPGPDCNGTMAVRPDEPICRLCKYDLLDCWQRMTAKE
jgi:hypothetical protein